MERQRERRQDPAFKEKANAQRRARRNDPAFKEKANAQRRLSRERRRQEEAALFSAPVPSAEAAEQRPKADAACETWDLERGDDHQVFCILSLDPFLPTV